MKTTSYIWLACSYVCFGCTGLNLAINKGDDVYLAFWSFVAGLFMNIVGTVIAPWNDVENRNDHIT